MSAVSFGGTSGVVGSALAGSYGSLTVNADGSYSYVVNNANAAVQALNVGQSLTEVFTYTVRDASGATSNTTLTVTIDGPEGRGEVSYRDVEIVGARKADDAR